MFCRGFGEKINVGSRTQTNGINGLTPCYVVM
jgi:hypothetical protein